MDGLINKKGDFKVKLLSLENRIQNAGNQLCAWWKDTIKNGNHWDNIGYKQGLRDALEILKKHKVIIDYSVTNGVKIRKEET